MPITPEKGVKIEFAKAANGGGHLTLKRLPAHLAIGYNFEPGIFLQRNGSIDSTIFDFFKFRSAESPGGKLFLRKQQFRRSEQTANDIGVSGNHAFLYTETLIKLSGFNVSLEERVFDQDDESLSCRALDVLNGAKRLNGWNGLNWRLHQNMCQTWRATNDD